LSGGDGAKGADGFTFLLNGGGSNALGAAGSKLGYGGISQSLAIEFDTYNWKEVNGNHVALLTNGNTSKHLSLGTPGFDLNGSGPLTAWIDYSGQNDKLSVYISDSDTRPTVALFEHTIDIASVLGEDAYVGFSGGTGGLTNNQDIYNWEFSSSSGTEDVPNDGHGDGGQSGSPSYRDELVVGNLRAPVSMAALPDGRMLILEKFGTIRITDPQASVPTTSIFLKIPEVDSNGERGLLDITLDPEFESNGHFYVLYSSKATDRLQVSRFTVGQDGHTDHAHASTEKVIWQDKFKLSGTEAFHQGGGLDFGPDGKIYVSLGDRKKPNSAQKLNNTAGKILRINKDLNQDGDIVVPDDNPFYDGEGPNLDEIWAYGTRNPFRARWDVPTERFFIGDVGGNVQKVAREEINLGKAGANYGWPNNEGFTDQSQFTNPLFAYDHKEVDPFGGSIVGGMVYRGDQFSEELQGAYVFGDFVQGWIRYLRFDETGDVIDADPSTAKVDAFELVSSTGDIGNDFDSGNQFLTGSLVSLEEGTDGAIYYLNIFEGELKRIVYESGVGNQAPAISQANADVTQGGNPLTVSFSAVASDPDNDPLTYTWLFGDDNQATGVNVNHVYNQAGSYEATLVVSDGSATSRSTPITINVGQPPEAAISSHADGYLFRAGDQISFVGSGSDSDGTLTNESYEWDVRFVHNDHFHPVLSDQTGSTFVFNIPDSGHSFADETGFEVTLTVTDADGLKDTEVIQIKPDKVDLSVSSNLPNGVSYVLDEDEAFSGSFTYDTAINFNHKLKASETVVYNGIQYTFDGWSNGETTSTIQLTVPDQDFALQANYLPVENSFGFAFANFSDASGLRLNGSADVTAGVLQLTPAENWQNGSAFYNQAINIGPDTSLSTEFQFQLSDGDGIAGADGFTFMLQSDNLTTLGAAGSGLGYDGISQSVAVEFDTYKWKELNNNHVAVLKNGNKSKHLAIATPTLDLNGGDILNAWIDYDGATNLLEVFVSGSANKPGASLLSHNINLDAILSSTAYAGFSGGTGGLTNAQDILNWEMSVV
ncbi:MAG: PQQ-dependent sugar dehydrogenase, partial [Phormidesmis sp.]